MEQCSFSGYADDWCDAHKDGRIRSRCNTFVHSLLDKILKLEEENSKLKKVVKTFTE